MCCIFSKAPPRSASLDGARKPTSKTRRRHDDKKVSELSAVELDLLVAEIEVQARHQCLESPMEIRKCLRKEVVGSAPRS